MLALEAAQLDGPHLSCLYPEGVFYDLDSCKSFSYPDSDGGPDSTWGWTEAPPAPAIAAYEAFDPAATAAFAHTQAVQLCYGHGPSPSTYSPVGTLDPAPSLEASGPGLQVYPSEDFTSQVHARSCACTSSCWSYSCAGTCASACGGWSQVLASSSSPPSTRSCWLAAGASRRATANA
ncbi:transcription factor Spi-B isoform X19 [Rattus norvegicus]|uniref:transcription factor Spi-B isoform X19 n=1 Tax=Rattus norvegicus TaxID=10116 RepID=UPI002FD86736